VLVGEKDGLDGIGDGQNMLMKKIISRSNILF
jgi:hypothetical protein